MHTRGLPFAVMTAAALLAMQQPASTFNFNPEPRERSLEVQHRKARAARTYAPNGAKECARRRRRQWARK